MKTMNSDVMQQWWTHMQLFEQRKDSIMVFGLVWFVVNEKQDK